MNPRWLLNASRWARNPPSAKRVLLVLGVIAFCLVLAGLERMTGGGGQAQNPLKINFTRN